MGLFQVSEARSLDRDFVEADLIFAGFAVINNFKSLYIIIYIK